jgi:hypothetical protein
MAEQFRDSAMAMSDFMITIEANSMEAGKSMSQINSYVKSNKNKLWKEIASATVIISAGGCAPGQSSPGRHLRSFPDI